MSQRQLQFEGIRFEGWRINQRQRTAASPNEKAVEQDYRLQQPRSIANGMPTPQKYRRIDLGLYPSCIVQEP